MICPVCAAPQIVLTHAAVVPIEEVSVGSTDMRLVQRSWFACLACHARWYIDAAPTVRVTVEAEKKSPQPTAGSPPKESPQPAADSRQKKKKPQPAANRETGEQQTRSPPDAQRPYRPAAAPRTPVPPPPVMHDPSGLYVRLPVGRDVVSAAQGFVDLLSAASGVARDVERVQRRLLRGKKRR